MKIRLNIIFLMLTIAVMFSGCSSNVSFLNKNMINIVCCGFSEYDWTRNIVGEMSGVNVIMIPDTGVELHSYTPTASDIIMIAKSDMIVYNGGASSKVIEDILNSNPNNDRAIVNCMETLNDVKLSENHIRTDECEHHHSTEEWDEHIWLSLKNARIICKDICDKISEIDINNKSIYEDNFIKYQKQINDLNDKYSTSIAESKFDEVIFLDRFPFIYMMNDYKLDYTAAFPGCSTEVDASFKTIVYLSDKLKLSQNKKAVILNKGTSSIATSTREILKCDELQVFAMDSIQSVTKIEVNEGYSFLKAMEYNLNTLINVLN